MTNPMIYRLIYLSSGTEAVTAAIIDQIVAEAQVKNAKQRVTGLLAYNGRNFMQVLEGESSIISELFQRIETDPRHRDVTILIEEYDVARAFDDWAMQALSLASGVLSRRAQMESIFPARLSARARAIMLSIATFG